MGSDFLHFFVAFGAGVLLSALFLTIFYFRKLSSYRKQSVRQSRTVILGEVTEKLLPLFQDFPYQPKDLVFVGKGVDYVVFDGLSEGNLRKIVFLEVKSGKSQLNKNEKMIQDYLSRNGVQYEIMHVKY